MWASQELEGLALSCCAQPPPAPPPSRVTLLQPLQLFLQLPLLPGQQPQVGQAGPLQSLQMLAKPGLGLRGVLPLQVPQPVQRPPGHVPLRPLHALPGDTETPTQRVGAWPGFASGSEPRLPVGWSRPGGESALR